MYGVLFVLLAVRGRGCALGARLIIAKVHLPKGPKRGQIWDEMTVDSWSYSREQQPFDTGRPGMNKIGAAAARAIRIDFDAEKEQKEG
jgi:hypothetical protein